MRRTGSAVQSDQGHHVVNRALVHAPRRCRAGAACIAAATAAITGCSPFRVPAPPPPSPEAAAHRFLTRAALVADIDSMLATVERVHPNPYTVASRDSVRTARDAIVATLPDSASRLDVWPSFARLLGMVGDGHTTVQLPSEEVRRFALDGGLMFPVRTTLSDSATLTVTAYLMGDTLLHRGDQILSVNGHATDSLLRTFARELGGETERWREQVVARQFETYLLLNGIHPPFSVEVRSPRDEAATRRMTIQGISQDSLAAIVRRGSGSAPRATVGSPNFSYRKLDDGTGYLDLFSLGGDRGRFRSDLDRAFEQLRADSARRLVVDLRRNGGGDTRLGEELLSHLTAEPYRMSSAKLWKMSREYRAFLKSQFRAPLNHLPIEKVVPPARPLYSGPDGKIVRMDEAPEAHSARDPRFDGPVCVLIGPFTFSSAADLADAIKTYHLATLVGEETGGHPNTFGEVYWFRLRATDFLVFSSSAAFVRANGDTTDRRGVLPDIEVRPTVNDIRSRRDPALARASDCPARAP